MFMEDFTRGRLLQTLGLPDDTLNQGGDIKHRCFVPISNGTAQVGADRGTHWSERMVATLNFVVFISTPRNQRVPSARSVPKRAVSKLL